MLLSTSLDARAFVSAHHAQYTTKRWLAQTPLSKEHATLPLQDKRLQPLHVIAYHLGERFASIAPWDMACVIHHHEVAARN
jgi:hypothetical protein